MINTRIFEKPQYEWLITMTVHCELTVEQQTRLVYLLSFTNPLFSAEWFDDEVEEYRQAQNKTQRE